MPVPQVATSAPSTPAARLDLHIRHRSPHFWLTQAVCRPGTDRRLPERQLHAHVIAFTRSGVWVRHAKGEDAVGDPNHVIFFNPNEPYVPSHPGGHGDDTDLISIHPRVVIDAITPWDASASERPQRTFSFIGAPIDPSTCLMQRMIFSAARGPDPADPLTLEEAVLRLIGRVIDEAYTRRGHRRSAGATATERGHAERADAVKAVLSTRFRERLTIDMVSDLVEVSPFHLCRIFRKHAGTSIHRYLNRLRLRASLDMLADRRMPLTDIASSLGFSSHSHFTAAFRAEFGRTPSGVRAAIHEGRGRDRWDLLAEFPGRPVPHAAPTRANPDDLDDDALDPVPQATPPRHGANGAVAAPTLRVG